MIEEKSRLQEIEAQMRQKLRQQWLYLTGCRQNTVSRPIHQSWWGHRTKSWRRSSPPPSCPPYPETPLPTDDQLVPEPDPPPVLPPVLPPLDNYTNKSIIISCPEGDWNVDPEDVASVEDLETSSASSVLEEESDEMTRAEVHAFVSDLDQQEEDVISTEMAMIAHPPPFFTVREYEDYDGEEYDAIINQGYENNYAVECEESASYHQGYENNSAVECEESAGYQDQVGDPYATEFAAFYAAYEEGADHLYYRDDGEQDDGRD